MTLKFFEICKKRLQFEYTKLVDSIIPCNVNC